MRQVAPGRHARGDGRGKCRGARHGSEPRTFVVPVDHLGRFRGRPTVLFADHRDAVGRDVPFLRRHLHAGVEHGVHHVFRYNGNAVHVHGRLAEQAEFPQHGDLFGVARPADGLLRPGAQSLEGVHLQQPGHETLVPGLAFPHAFEDRGFRIGVTRHVHETPVDDGPGRGLAQGQAPAAEDDLVPQGRRRPLRNAAALDVQFVGPVQLFGQVAGHDLGQSRLQAASQDDEPAGTGMGGRPGLEVLVGHAREIHVGHPRLEGQGDGRHARRAGQGRHARSVVLHHGDGLGGVVHVQPPVGDLVRPRQSLEPGAAGPQLFLAEIADGDPFHRVVHHGVVCRRRTHQAAADHEHAHGRLRRYIPIRSFMCI